MIPRLVIDEVEETFSFPLPRAGHKQFLNDGMEKYNKEHPRRITCSIRPIERHDYGRIQDADRDA